MTHLFIDREATEFDRSVQTWAELLSTIDRTMDARGRVVTEVHFDGVGEPTFRDASALDRALTTVRRIDASTSTPAELLRDCLLEAAGTVAGLAEESRLLADQFRSAHPVAAQARLAHLAHELGQLMLLVRTLQGPLGIVTAGAGESPDAEQGQFDGFATFVGVLLEAQQAADYPTVADILEDDLTPFLRDWQGRFERLAA